MADHKMVCKLDREIVLESVKQNGYAFKYADELLKKDEEFILEVVKQDGLAIKHADSSLQKDREIVLEAVKQNVYALKYADSSLKKDREIILKSVKKNGLTLEFTDSSLKKDREIVSEAVKQHGLAIEFADSSFKKDREIVLEAVKQNVYAIEFADSSLKKDRQFVLEAVTKNGLVLEYADSSLKKDREFVLESVTKNGYAFQYAVSSFKKDREIVLEAVKQNGAALKYADESVKGDREIVLEAVKQNGLAFKYIYSSLKKNREIILEAVKQNGSALKHADSFLKKDREIVSEAVKQNGLALQFADSSFKKDREIVLESVKKNGSALEYADSSFKKDREFIYLLFKLNKENARNFSPSISKTIEECLNIQRKLSSNITEQYSKIFMDEKDLYYAIELTSLFNPTPKGTIFNFNSIYTPIFIEKLIIFQILKQMNHSELSNDIIALIDLQSTKANYYLYCFRLDKFLEDNPCQSTRMKDLKNIVEQVATNFETSFYTKQEINEIMIFANKWFENEQTFENYKQIICKYNELRGDLSKVFKSLNYFYNYFKNDYDFISVLGYGGEGVAFKVFHKSSKSLRALKLKYDPEESEESTKETINLLKRTDIEGKIKCFDCEIIQNHLYSVMELGEESLSNYISRNNESEIYRNGFIIKEKLIEILDIFIKVLNSVQSIHDHNILHRDLDPQNIVKVQDLYKIIDFETSRVIKTGNSITIARGKFAYMSPEVSHDNYSDDLLKSGNDEKLAHNVGQITISCDIFSLGCILLKLLTNCPLQLCSTFLNDSDVSKYNDNYLYFSGHGKYFYTVVTTTEGEMKLHYAIEKLINETINPDLGVNNILIRSIISMIQRDSSKRLDCYSHKLTIENILKFLKGEIKDITFNIEKQVGELKKISPLRSYSQLVEENTKLLERIKLLEENSLLERIKMLEEEIINLKTDQ
ncbi:serine-threonine kinase [Naegleria gruberi]|uniref:non-specific serine/threonine protein kinase n=1 Tax=Naegleria gruberi TaxID=5762 RepID=D2V8X5_NAEGR|nr:serine-threonine kinase [Naegleria gruberi]EFC46766.1 serine-threonine kinase [Naegleria gruberi]|eukprot:XP_002679510.1 serine-threonine kinase [Naegleria gruberi strain NEG-M]